MTPQELAAKTGEVIGTSDWFHVTQERINMFADATGDHQFIHIDEEKAKLTPFGGTIAHGFLTLSLLPVLGAMTEGGRVSGVKMGVNYGGNKTRFLSPVRAGKRGELQRFKEITCCIKSRLTCLARSSLLSLALWPSRQTAPLSFVRATT